MAVSQAAQPDDGWSTLGLNHQRFKLPRPNAPEERDKLHPGDIRLSPRRIVTPASKYLNSRELPVDLLNNLFRSRPPMFAYTGSRRIRVTLPLKTLASVFLHSLFQEALMVALRECSA